MAPSARSSSTKEVLRVLVVDDEAVVREGLCRLIAHDQRTGVQVLAVASTTEALRQVPVFAPHIVVLDVDLAGDDGLGLMPRLSPDVRVVVLTSDTSAATRRRALALGACDFLHKLDPGSTLLASLQALAPPHMRGDQSPCTDGASSPAASVALSDAQAPSRTIE
ncbi:response regulator [Piscinibacter sp. XHJ-5]|uniref:response regulator transcription factor n=1 Tax=Piscinibacter sp. XHJ-5 TaxID=3037797 RepID=UPI0024531503|nr:response regulator [Piscinibacter sp. XHJ-5]